MNVRRNAPLFNHRAQRDTAILHSPFSILLSLIHIFLDNAESKLRRKNCDMLVANSLRDKGAGFGTDTNVATLLFKDGHRETPPMMSKEALADLILDRLLSMK